MGIKNSKNNQLKIRKVTHKDAKSIRRVQHDTWLSSYINKKYNITPEDIEAKNFLSKESIEKTHKFFKENPNCWVAEIEGKVVGFVWPRIEKGKHRIGSIYILPDYQGMGIGTRFMDKVFEVHKGHDIYLNVVAYNKSAVKFYERFGSKNTGKKKDHSMPNGKVIPTVEMVRKGN